MRADDKGSDDGVRAEVFRGHERFEQLADAYDALLARTDAPVSVRRDSVVPWFRHHPRVVPWGVLLWSGPELVAGALMAHQVRAGIHLFATPNPGGEGCLPAASAAASSSLARALADALNDLGRPWHLRLSGLVESDPTAGALRRALAFTAVTPHGTSSQLRFAPGQPLFIYLSRNTRAAVAKARNRIHAAGFQLDLTWNHEPDGVARCLDEIVDVHRQRNLQLRGMSLLDDPTELAMFIDTVRAHAAANRVRLLTVRIDEALAAFALCMEATGTLSVYSNMASPDWLEFSPGRIANAEVVRAAYADPAITCVDWGPGIQRYKLSGDVTLVQTYTTCAWSSRSARFAQLALASLRARWRRLARHPLLASVTGRPRQLLRQWRGLVVVSGWWTPLVLAISQLT